MAQQEPIDQRKLFTQTLIISMIIWLLVIMGWSYFSRPTVSDKQPDQIVAEIEQLRAEKDYVEASRRAQELATRYRGAEFGALGILLEAKIFYEDKQDAREAYNRLRQLEELYPNTQVYKEQGLPLLEQVSQKIDQEMGQLPSYRALDAIMNLFSFAGDGRFILGIFFIAALIRLIQVPLVNRQFASMRKMLQLQPKLLELQQKYTGQELMQRQMGALQKVRCEPDGRVSLCAAADSIPDLGLQCVFSVSGAVPCRALSVGEPRYGGAVSRHGRRALGTVRRTAGAALCR